MPYYILDLEYNQHFDFHDKSSPEPACPAEIIQMGVVVMDSKFNVKLRRETLVRPQIYNRLHPYVERITGISMDDLRRAPVFPDVFDTFFDLSFGRKAAFCTWGQDDIKELYKNIFFYELNHKRLPRKYLNVQKLFGAYHRTMHPAPDEGEDANGSRQIGLRSAVEGLGLPSCRPFHMALSDAEYTAEVLGAVLSDKRIRDSRPNYQTLDLKKLREHIESRVNSVNVKQLYKHGEHLLGRKLNERDKAALIEIYTFGRLGKFDINGKGKRRKNGKVP